MQDLSQAIKDLSIRIKQEEKVKEAALYMLSKVPGKDEVLKHQIKEAEERLLFLQDQVEELRKQQQNMPDQQQLSVDSHKLDYKRSQSTPHLQQLPQTRFSFMRADRPITKDKVHYLHLLSMHLVSIELNQKQALEQILKVNQDSGNSKEIERSRNMLKEAQARLFVLQRAISLYDQLDFQKNTIAFDKKYKHTGKLMIQVLKLEGVSGKRSESTEVYVKVRINGHDKMMTRPSRTNWNDELVCQVEHSNHVELAIFEQGQGLLAMTFFTIQEFLEECGNRNEGELTCLLHLFPSGTVQLSIKYYPRKQKTYSTNLMRRSQVQKQFVKQRHRFEILQSKMGKCAVCHEFMLGSALCCIYCSMVCHKSCLDNIGIPQQCRKATTQDNRDGDELVVKHKIPHRFQKQSSLAVSWCVHCGKMLPIGKHSHLTCSECRVSCHFDCEQFVPDYCGLPPALLSELRSFTEKREKSKSSSHSESKLQSEVVQSRSQLEPAQTRPPKISHSESSKSIGSKLKSMDSTMILGQPKKLRQESLNYFRHGSKGVGLDDFTFLTVLGKGNFGKVMLCQEKFTNNYYAIKVLKKDFILEHDEVESTKSEKNCFQIATQVMHPFLVHLHSCFQTESRLYFVMEYVCGGDLMYHIQQKKFTPAQAKFYACEVLLALEYWHQHNILYRDLKLDNILLSTDGHVKIADYGLCKAGMGHGVVTNTFCGTPEFMAPEILSEQPYTRAVDWWSFGVLVYEMLLGKVMDINQAPFAGDNEEKIFNAILTKNPSFPPSTDPVAVDLMQKLLHKTPKKRLGASIADAQEIKSHEYFKGVNWDDVYHLRNPPPFKPKSPSDTSNFDPEFTNEVPVLTPVHSILSRVHQEEFRGFTHVTEWARKSREAVCQE